MLVSVAFAQTETPSYPNPILTSNETPEPIAGAGGEVVSPGDTGVSNALGADPGGQPTVLRLELDEDVPATVPTASLRTTTLVFPFLIRALEGVGFTTDPATVKGDFLLSAKTKLNRASINPLRDNVRRNLNVVSEDGRVFPLDIVPARPAGAAAFVVHFRLKGPAPLAGLPVAVAPGAPVPEPPMPDGGAAAASVRRSLTAPAAGKSASPARLKGSIDAAKLLTGLPNDAQVQNIIGALPNTFFRRGAAAETAKLGPVDLRLLSVMRSDGIDTLVLAFAMKANSAVTIDRTTWTVRVTDAAAGPLLRAALVDAPVQMPAGQTATVYLAFTGGADGSRNRVSVENFFFPSVTLGQGAPPVATRARK